MSKNKLKKLLLLKWKYAQAKLVSTGVDYGLYMLFVQVVGMKAVVGNALAYGIAILVSFLMERFFVFDLKRKNTHAFAGAMIVSGIGLVLSTGLVWMLDQIVFLHERQYLLKLIAIGIMFFYNFYFKRFVFERRFFSMD